MNLNLKRLYHVCNPERACLDGILPSLQWRIRCIDIRERQGAALLAMGHAGLNRGPEIFTELAERTL